MRKRPILKDECVSTKVGKYLKKRGMEVYVMPHGSSDYEVRRAGDELGAYIITKDRGFNDYENAFYVHGMENHNIYRSLKKLMDAEFDSNIHIGLPGERRVKK